MAIITTNYMDCSQVEAKRMVIAEYPDLKESLDALFNARANGEDSDYLYKYGFEFLGNGSYKCAFKRDGYVFKLASQKNATDRELEVLTRAEAQGINFFAPSLIIPFPGIFLSEVYEDDSENGDCSYYNEEEHTWVEDPEYDSPVSAYLIIQDEVRPMEDFGWDYLSPYDNFTYSEAEFNANVAFDPAINPALADLTPDYKSWERLPITSMRWWSDVITSYGLHIAQKLAKFFLAERIWDIRWANLGVNAAGAPVCFDFL